MQLGKFCWFQVEANKDQSLARRIQRLQRFLLDKLHHESLQRQAQHTSQPEASEAVQDTTAASTAEADALDQSEGTLVPPPQSASVLALVLTASLQDILTCI